MCGAKNCTDTLCHRIVNTRRPYPSSPYFRLLLPKSNHYAGIIAVVKGYVRIIGYYRTTCNNVLTKPIIVPSSHANSQTGYMRWVLKEIWRVFPDKCRFCPNLRRQLTSSVTPSWRGWIHFNSIPFYITNNRYCCTHLKREKSHLVRIFLNGTVFLVNVCIYSVSTFKYAIAGTVLRHIGYSSQAPVHAFEILTNKIAAVMAYAIVPNMSCYAI